MEHVLTMANLKLKPSLFTPRPSPGLLFTELSRVTPNADTFSGVLRDHGSQDLLWSWW